MAKGHLPEYLTHFRRRVLCDALLEATTAYWDARAVAFEWARPRPGEFHGQANTADLNDAYSRGTAAAANCRHHAALLRDTGLDAETQAAIAEMLDQQVAS